MKRFLLALTLAGLALTSFAQDKPTVSINAKGDDVRSVIHDIFKQSGKNFVLNPGVRFVLYLSLDKVDFEEALTLVCKNANLKYEVQNGIYHISTIPPKVVEEKKPVTKTVEIVPIKIKRTLPTTVLAKRLTTRFTKTDLREVMASFGEQTGAPIEVAKDVPAYKLDAFLINTSLKYALDQVTKAAKLEYRFTDEGTILVFIAKKS